MQPEIKKSEEVFAKLNKFDLEEPMVHCPSGKRVAEMCINTECKASLFCNSDRCKFCQSKHEKCNTIKLSTISREISKWAKNHKEYLQKVIEVDQKLIKLMKKNQQELFERYEVLKLNFEHESIIDKIYMCKDGNISGAEALECSLQVQTLNPKEMKKLVKTQLSQYQAQMEKLQPVVSGLKEKLVPEVKNLRQTNFDISSFRPKLKFKSIDSFILDNSTEEKRVQINYLFSALNQPKELKLLYRASEHYFRAKTFHKKCDNIQDTLTIVKTQFGKTMAGFTHYKWNEVDGSLKDQDKKAFLLQLDLREKYLPTTDTSLIFCNHAYGPTFGAGRDLYIADKCNNNNSSCAFFPSTYNLEEPYQYSNGQESYQAFSGAAKDQYFNVVEYEVFQVTFDEKKEEEIKEQKKEQSCIIQ